MSKKSKYRKLVIGDETYQFVIGKKFVKLRNGNDSQVIPKEKMGVETESGKFIVTPGMIKLYLENKIPKIEDFFPTCRCVGIEKTLALMPFALEVDGIFQYVNWCKRCFDRNAYEI